MQKAAIILHNCRGKKTLVKIKSLQKIGHEFVSGKSLNPQLHIIYWVPLPHSVSNPNEINLIVASMYIMRKMLGKTRD